MLAKKVFIIAEAGVNHNGSFATAKKMIDAAKKAGVDAVKFQTFSAKELATRGAVKAEYQKKNTAARESQFDMLKRLELGYAEQERLKEYADKKKIMFLSSPFDLKSVQFLAGLGLTIFKVPSGEITNLPYLRAIGRLKKKVVLSTGMAEMGEIKNALSMLIAAGTKKRDITVLHCNSAYPTPIEDANLLAMPAIGKTLGVKYGYSDHTPGINVAIAATALGASVIEKHFTLDKNMDGPDHKASLSLDELVLMVKAIRIVEKAMGSGIKKPSLSELKNIRIVRKSIVAARPIGKGEIFSERNLTTKRPADGISPMKIDGVVGRKAKRDFVADEVIEL